MEGQQSIIVGRTAEQTFALGMIVAVGLLVFVLTWSGLDRFGYNYALALQAPVGGFFGDAKL